MRNASWLPLLILILTSSVIVGADGHPGSDTHGLYLEGGGGSNPRSSATTLGFTGFFNDTTSMVIGLHLAGSQGLFGDNDSYFGGIGWVNYAYPAIVSPYVGFGALVGYSGQDRGDESGIHETSSAYELIAGCFPEGGVRFWLHESVNLSINAKYFITTEGRNQDYWIASFGLAILTGD